MQYTIHDVLSCEANYFYVLQMGAWITWYLYAYFDGPVCRIVLRRYAIMDDLGAG